jgi:hypothetical protein
VNKLTSFYQWLNKSFTQQILFKNKEDGDWGIKKLLEKHSKGETSIPTELE